MSNNATPERCVPHKDAWPYEKRLELMRDVVRMLAERGALKLENAAAIAETYGVPAALVEAEMLKYPTEECGK